ncbi:MAG: ATP-binding cassette domain-containing protein [Actinobacteria bacterium]|nr:ATP-binding cassette domain-containing protein [Actinomycetota bacterium]
MTADLAVDAHGLVKTFGDVRALDGVDLVVPRGTVVGLLGPNGSGKTTTVRILATLLQATAGTAKVNGFDVKSQADDVRRSIGLTGQYAAVDEFLTGRENLMMFGGLYHLDKAYVSERSDELLATFDLVDAADRPAKTYSGGMRRRLDLAASLIAKPGILFLDEPTTGLDPRSRIGLWNVMKGLVAEGTTVLLTTQYLDEADQLADDIVVLDHGKVIAHGTSSALKDEIGGDRLEVRLAREDQTSQAVSALVPLATGEIVTQDGLISAPITGGSTTLIEAVRALDAQQIEVDDIALRRPTLDDVFLSLTGHATEDETPAPPSRSRRRGPVRR